MSFENHQSSEQYADRRAREAAVAPALGDLSLQPRQQIDILLREYDIRVNQRKVPLRLPRESADYTAYRRGFLKAVAARQSLTDEPHPPLKPLEAWRDMGEDGQFPQPLMIGIKKWLPFVRYGRQSLVEWNGKRGRGAYYSAHNDYYLNVVDTTEEQEPELPEFPTPQEIYEAVRHLAQFGFVFEEHGVMGVDPMLEIALQKHKTDYQALKSEGISVKDFRAEAMSKIELLLDDPQFLGAFRRGFGPKAAEAGLANYLGDLDPGERYLVKRLLRSSLEPVTAGGRLRLEAVDEKGMLLGILQPQNDISPAVESESPLKSEASITDSAERQSPKEQIPVAEDEEAAETAESEDRLQPLFDVVEAVANDTAATFLQTLKGDRGYRLSRIQAIFPNITTAKLMSSKENRVINPTRDQPIYIEDVIRIVLHNDVYLRNIFRTRKYKDRIEGIIKKAVEDNMMRVEQELEDWD